MLGMTIVIDANISQVFCIGANWMNDILLRTDDDLEAIIQGQLIRSWSWLVVCDDGRWGSDLCNSFY